MPTRNFSALNLVALFITRPIRSASFTKVMDQIGIDALRIENVVVDVGILPKH
ncbi:hypothetical protein J2T20_002948 [Paenibacillus wynnii]|nr:hypothetical protein [Paenibacillus wynnii]